jgi:TRAP-type uncharacterized transport system substrate-binding protein
MSAHGEKLLGKYLDRLQQSETARRAIAGLLVAIVVGAAGYFVYDLIPRSYHLSITGGDILGNRHFVAKVLQEELASERVALRIAPSQGTYEALEAVDSGHLDLALIQGGLNADMPNIRHVATLAPEILHFLVRPDIRTVADLKGRTVNLGGKTGGTRVVAKQVLSFSGLQEGIDYIETNHGVEALVGMKPEKLPDAVVNLSFLPAYLADFLIKERGYRLLEIPFPASLALREGWVADGRILGYTYSIAPPVPERDMRTVGVNLHLVANKAVEPKAVFKVLEALYGPKIESRLRMRFDERNIAAPSGYPLSDGTVAFLARNTPMLSAKVLDSLKSIFGLVMTSLSAFIVMLRWFRGQQSTDDKTFKGYCKQVADIEAAARDLDVRGDASRAEVQAVEAKLSALKQKILTDYPTGMFKDGTVVEKLLVGLADTRGYLLAVSRRVEERERAAV